MYRDGLALFVAALGYVVYMIGCSMLNKSQGGK